MCITFIQLLLTILIILAITVSCKKAKKLSFSKDDYKLFIIAGTQKSGTTVLSGLLAEHPLIAFSKKKELHFFDKDVNYEKGIRHFLKSFSPKQNTAYIGESTPYYVAHREACARIAEHFPNVKMIVMLREPIQRAYSEYQMKLRRVDKQNTFFAMLQENIPQYRRCLRDTHIDELKNSTCFPEKMRQHVTFKKLYLAVRKALDKNLTQTAIIDRCFPEDAQESAVLDISDHPCEMLPPSVRPYCRTTTISLSQGFFWLSSSTSHLEASTLSSTREYFNISSFRSYFEMKSYRFDPKACFKDYPTGYEKIKPLHQALVEEALDFDNCADLDKSLTDLPIFAEDENVSEERQVEILDKSLDWALERLEHVDDAVDHCLNVRGGISAQYIYRSLYAVQLYNCFQDLEPDQFLFIPSGDMRKYPARVLHRVLQFLELPSNTSWIMNITKNMEGVVSNRYQDFAKTTSWQLNSDYNPLEEDIKTSLEDFFDFYNNLLFRLLGEDFSDRW